MNRGSIKRLYSFYTITEKIRNINGPDIVQYKFTVLLLIIFDPVYKKYFSLYFSVIIDPSGDINLAWFVLPRIESIKEDKKPAIITKRMAILSLVNKYPINPMVIEPNNDPTVPIIVIPPDVPGETLFLDIISIGSDFDSFPNSVPQVSEFAAATDAKKQG